MKKSIKLAGFTALSGIIFMSCGMTVKAATAEQLEMVPNGSYIIGEKTLNIQTFTREEIFNAIRTIQGDNHIYYKNYSGNWTNVFDPENPETMDIPQMIASVQTNWQPGMELAGYKIDGNNLVIKQAGIYTASSVGRDTFDNIIIEVPSVLRTTPTVQLEGFAIQHLEIKSATKVELVEGSLQSATLNAEGIEFISQVMVNTISVQKNNISIHTVGNTEITKGETVEGFMMTLDLAEKITAQTNSLIEKYSNKFHNGDIITSDTLDSSVYYVELGNYFGAENPTEMKIGENTYNTLNFTLSIGNNARIKAPVWKIENGKVYAALTWLATNALPGQLTEVVVGGQTYRVNVYNQIVADNQLVLEEVGVLGTRTGYTNEAFIENNNTVVYRYGHRAHYVGIKVSLNGTMILDPQQVIFRMAPNGGMGLVTPESNYTYTLYDSYANSPVTEANHNIKDYKIAIPNQGVITIHFKMNAVVD